MKILHITDSHGTVKSPESRTDLFYLTFLRKLAEITYVVKLEKIDMVLHTGDLFHSSRVSNKFMGQVAEIIQGWGVPLYVVPGNHDIDGYTIDTIDQTSLGLLAKTGVLTLLTRDNPIRINATQGSDKFTVAISGQEYYSEIDTGNMNDFEMQQAEADINILAIHGYIADTKQHPNIRCTYPKDIITDADIILSGHYHRSFALDVGDTSYYNPGSMLRVEMTEYNKAHMPQYGILEIELDKTGCVVYDYKFHQFRIAKPSSVVFDFNSTALVKKHGITLENFKTSIANTMQNININVGISPKDTIKNAVIEYCKANSVPLEQEMLMTSEIENIYDNASIQVTDDDAITTKGFIPASIPIKIKSIDIENFQSHENTHVDFDSGLNVIIGESNNGKTSILRAMDWVVDNQPLGTDFIMTGKKYCKVRITYDNDTFIERYRTLKDTGYYRVGVINNGQESYQEYKGFTNNVPVEVMNVHQMPKIAITKNIETHLNKLSQLERPFLITENTNEKAAAIGRITGTNIIDVAIKNTTSDIASDRKLLKTYIKDKTDLESARDAIDLKRLYDLSKFYSMADKKIKELDSLSKTMNDLLDREKICITNIKQYENIKSNCEDIIKDKTTVNEAEELILKISKMINLLNGYKQCKEFILDLNNKIKLYNKTIKQKKVIDSCSDAITKITCLISLYKRYELSSNAISIQNNRINLLSDMTKYSDIINEQQDNIIKIQQMINLYIRDQSIKQKIQENNDDSSSIISTIDSLNCELQEYETNMKEFVLSNKICPCCGQKITDKNVSSIINNFSREV